ncbi:hypothetical protein [Raoultella terrigena]|uniref:hypothetical protein n=1 Tax=Raoultella terrigena TaxID=577 RepID=UPI000977FC5E|nr:hypothetical protein [Raoultella terrigena]OMP91103.1 hypothetical protein BZP36_22225 [Raoultella terrigena]
MTFGEKENNTAIKRMRTELANIRHDGNLVSLLCLLTEELIKNTPVIGKPWEVSSKVLKRLDDIEKNEQAERINHYILGLSKLSREQMDGDLSSADLLAILRRLLEDDEAGKTRFYVRLTVSLAESKLDAGQRIHFVRLVSALTLHQIDYARELYIRKTIPLQGYNTEEMTERALTGRTDGMSRQALNTLLNWGLLTERENKLTWDKKESSSYRLNEDFRLLVAFLFDEKDRQPVNINEQAKEIYDVILVRNLSSVNNLYESYIKEKLQEQGIQTGIVERTGIVEGQVIVGAHMLNTLAPYYLHTQILNVSSNQLNDKEYIQVVITRNGSEPLPNNDLNVRAFRIDKHIFWGTGKNEAKAASKLQSELDSIIKFILQLPKRPDYGSAPL